MAPINRPVADVDFILTEQDGHLSRDNGVLSSGENLPAGTILMASGNELVHHNGTLNSAGALTADAAGILCYSTDATAADVAVVYLNKDAEVNGRALQWPTDNTAGQVKAGLIVQLRALGIKVRE